jgi:DUF4097 and DUF4098 domain-containing protein YvlB
MRLQKTLIMLFVLGVFLLALGFTPSSAVAKERYEEKFEKTMAIAKDGKIYLSNISGDIRLETWDKTEVKIDALKTSRASSMERAKENAAKVNIEIKEEDGVLRIETKYPKMSIKNLNVSIDYNLLIPSMAGADVHSVSGDIWITNVGGMTKAETVSGEVTCEDIGGIFLGKSVSGDVHIKGAKKGVECHSVSGDVEAYDVVGDADLHSVSGEVTASRVEGSIEAETVSGDMRLTEVSEAMVVKAKALSGEVIYDGTINPDGRYSLKSHSGDIRMTIPGSSAFDLEAKTFSGDIETEFEITISGKMSKKKIRGSVNGGGADVDLSTFSGDVVLKKK